MNAGGAPIRRPRGGPLLGCLVLFSLGLPGVGFSQSDLPPAFESEIKAHFIYTLTKFVKWPPRSFPGIGAPMIFCALGEDPLIDAFQGTVDGKTVNGRRVAFRRIAGASDAEACQVLVIGSSEAAHLGEVLRRLRGSSVLTVGESAGFTSLGGIVRLRLQEGMVQSEINVPTARRAGLQISSEFLKLSGIVKIKNQGGS